MLTLSRTEQQSVTLRHRLTGDVITVTVTRSKHGAVRIGFAAGLDWIIYRTEKADEWTKRVLDITGCAECVKGIDKPMDDCEVAQ